MLKFFFGGEVANWASLARAVLGAKILASLARAVPKPLANVHPSLRCVSTPSLSS